MSDLTTAQLEAISHTAGPCLVVAGAGTGKTRVITERIANLILNEHVRPESILALTFTEKAAAEMQERLDVLLPYGVFGVTVGTFHGFANELIRRHAFRIGINPDVRLVTEADQVAILREHLSRLPLKKYITPYNPMPLLKRLAKYVEDSKEAQLSYKELCDHAAQLMKNAFDEGERDAAEEYAELAECVNAITTLYRELDVVTYADLLLLSHKLLTTAPAALKEEQARFTHILIDEFQDTNTLQAEVSYALAGSSSDANIFVVGDDDQSIYRFRGANVANILHFRERYPSAKVVTLTDNYRSSQPILDAAYRLIQHNNPHRLEAQLKVSKKLTAHLEATHTPEHLWYSTGTHEAENIAERIASLIREGYVPSEIAVLARSHNHLDSIEDELRNLSVPVTRSKEGSFFDEPSIVQALAFLRFLAHPHNSENLFALLTGAPFYLSGEHLAVSNITAKKKYSNLWQHLQSDPGTSSDVVEYLQSCLVDLASRDPATALREHVYRSKWQNTLVVEDDQTAARHLTALHGQARTFTLLQRPATISGFVDHCDRLAQSGSDVTVQSEIQAPGNGVQLMTVHASKGLEFRVVFVVNMVMRRFPGLDRTDGFRLPGSLVSEQKDSVPYEEERRLAYVACTRAKERLYITGAAHYGLNKSKSQPSVFITEALPSSTAPSFADATLRGSLLTTPLDEVKPYDALPFPVTLSASALEAFEDNPAEYYRQYVLNIIPEDMTAISFGTCIHSVLRDATQAQLAKQSFDLEQSFTRAWDGTGYATEEIRDLQQTAGLTMLRNYLAANPAIPAKYIEENVTFELPDKVRIVGKVDRVDSLADGSLRIVDYKTGSKEAKVADIKKNLPLAIYAAALTQRGERVRSIGLSYLRTGTEEFMEIDEQFISDTKEHVAALIEKMRIAYATRAFPDLGSKYH